MDLPETDSEDELPPGWEERVTTDGSVYYVNHCSKETQWTHPRTNRKKIVSGDLPYNWEKCLDENDRVYYKNNETGQTTFTDPRLVFAQEEKTHPYDFRQKYDASSTALQVLHGRDLTGKVALITGANCGIGFETFRSLAKHGCYVILACRNLEAAREAVKKVAREKFGAEKQCDVRFLDLCSLSCVKEFAKDVHVQYRKIDYLILNAGVFGIGHSLTEDGYETTFQVNHLSHFYLTSLFLPLLRKDSRVIVLSSESHRFSNLNITNMTEEMLSQSKEKYSSVVAYNNSKFCNVLFTIELSKLTKNFRNISVFAVHPGNLVSTYISRSWWVWRLLFAICRPFTKSVQQAASTTIYCATSPELKGLTGVYFNNCCVCPISDYAIDDKLSKKLYDISVRMIKQALGTNAFDLELLEDIPLDDLFEKVGKDHYRR